MKSILGLDGVDEAPVDVEDSLGKGFGRELGEVCAPWETSDGIGEAEVCWVVSRTG